MSKSAIETAKQYLVRFMGANSYEEVIRADEVNVKTYRNNAKRRTKLKSHIIPKSSASGNPYIMLQRKVNNKGKQV